MVTPVQFPTDPKGDMWPQWFPWFHAEEPKVREWAGAEGLPWPSEVMPLTEGVEGKDHR